MILEINFNMPIFTAFSVGNHYGYTFAASPVCSQLCAARTDEVESARCCCFTCNYRNPKTGNRNYLCPTAYGRIANKESWTIHINRAIRAGHIHECGGRYYSKDRVSEGGVSYKASDYYAVPFNDISLVASTCPCGAHRTRVVHTPSLVLTDPVDYLLGTSNVVVADPLDLLLAPRIVRTTYYKY